MSLLDYAIAHRDAVAEVEAQKDRATACEPANDDEPAEVRQSRPLDWLDAGPDDEPPPAPLKSRLVTPRRRGRLAKSGLRDREDRASRRAYRRSASTSQDTSSASPSARHSTPSPTPTSTPQNDNDSTPNSSTKKAGRKKRSRTRYVATWDQAGDMTRLGYVNDALVLRGRRFAYTLNLSPNRIAAANDNARGPLDHLWRELERRLGKALPDRALTHWMTLETTEDGRQHVHGAIAVNDDAVLPVIRETLRKTGGTWRSACRERQVDLAPQRDPDAWAAYPLKAQARTRRHVREALGLPSDAPVRIACWSRSLVADAKRLLAEERRAIGRR